MHELMRAHLVLDRQYVLVNVLVLPQIGLEHQVLLTSDLTSDRFLFTALSTLEQVFFSLLLKFLLLFFLLALQTARLTEKLLLLTWLQKAFLLNRVSWEHLVSLALVHLWESLLWGVFLTSLVEWLHSKVDRWLEHSGCNFDETSSFSNRQTFAYGYQIACLLTLKVLIPNI